MRSLRDSRLSPVRVRLVFGGRRLVVDLLNRLFSTPLAAAYELAPTAFAARTRSFLPVINRGILIRRSYEMTRRTCLEVVACGLPG